MYRLGFVLLVGLLFGCNNKKAPAEEEGEGQGYAGFSKRFKTLAVPYQITEEEVLHPKDTAVIRNPEYFTVIPDSVINRIFGSRTKVKFAPLARIESKGAETYYFVRAMNGSKRAVLLMTYDKDNNYGATLPVLVPDNDPNTAQSASIDKNYNISRNVVRRKGSEVAGEGKDVYVYNGAARQFTLIMTDLLDERNAELINPIDTLPRTNRFAGDYVRDKRNIVSIRDGRTPTQAIAFVHLDKNNGDCTGELKGEILFTSSTTAVYRQGGDPCVLQFSFSGNSVSLKEEQGCGNHRGLNCPLEGVFTKKKEARPKTSTKKGAKK